MESYGIALQILGVAMALVALGLEFLVNSKAGPVANPWTRPSTAKRRDISEAERTAFNDIWVPKDEHPDVQATREWLKQSFDEYRAWAADDWNEQTRRLREQQLDTRWRVRFEMVGLFVVAIGTMLSSLGD